MSVDARAEGIRMAEGELDNLARQLHGKGYRLLSDAEARQLWDFIEAARRQAAT
jgi:hypothetical protein